MNTVVSHIVFVFFGIFIFVQLIGETDRGERAHSYKKSIGQTIIPDSAYLTISASQECQVFYCEKMTVLCNLPSPRKNRIFLATLVLSFRSNTDCKVFRACDLQNSGFSSSTIGEHTNQKGFGAKLVVLLNGNCCVGMLFFKSEISQNKVLWSVITKR